MESKDTSQTLNCPDLEICNQSVNFFSIDSETNEAIPRDIDENEFAVQECRNFSDGGVAAAEAAVSAAAEAKEAYDAAVLSGNATEIAAAKEILDSAENASVTEAQQQINENLGQNSDEEDDEEEDDEDDGSGSGTLIIGIVISMIMCCMFFLLMMIMVSSK